MNLMRSDFSRLFWFGWFLAMLLVPAGMYAAGMRARPIEERPMSRPPDFNTARLFDPAYYGALDKALVEQNPAREMAIKAYARLGYFLFGDVTGTQVAAGKDGWIHLRQTLMGDCIPEDRMKSQIDHLAALGNALEASGKSYLFTVAPDKEAIYNDKLTPAQVELSACRTANREQLDTLLKQSGMVYFDAWSALRKLRAEIAQPVYVPYETHWTEYGSTVFIEHIVKLFAPDLSLGPLVEIEPQTKTPDLGRMAGMYFQRDFARVRFDRGGHQNRNSNQVPHPEPGRPFVHNTSTSDGAPLSSQRVLILHDSFMYEAWDQVSQFFSDTLYMHWDSITPERFAMLAATADIIIIQTVERETLERLATHFDTDAYASAILASSPELEAEAETFWPRPPSDAP